MKQETAIVILCLLAGHVHAQMHKCVQDGRVVYQQAACADERSATGMRGGTVSDVDAMSRQEIQRAMRPAPGTNHVNAQRSRSSAREAPTEQEIRNMETSANSITLSKREKMIRQAEIAAAKDAAAGGSGRVDYSAVEAEDARSSARRAAAAAQGHERNRAAAAQAAQGPAFDTLRNCTTASCRGHSGADYKPQPSGEFRRNDGARCKMNALGRMDC